MRRRASRASRRLTVAAVVLALAGGLAFQRYAKDLERTARPGGPMMDVVVAVADLARGAQLGMDDLSIARMPREYRPSGALTRAEPAVGRVLLAPIASGEVVTESRLGPSGGPVASLIPYGLRAVSITTALPAGSVIAGDHVDVVATFATGRPHTETVVEAVEILAVIEGDRASDVAGTTLMLLVSADDAERIAYARAFADLSVAIAPPGG
jgi:pilus assembly protein CpaB